MLREIIFHSVTTGFHYQINQYLSTLPKGRTEIPAEASFCLMQKLMKALNNPQDSLTKVIHIAGTNGKGSTSAILTSLLESQGYTVNLYTSPHLCHPTERIRLQGQDISPQQLLSYLEVLRPLHSQIPFNFFHALTSSAFLSFRDHPSDFIILETGMGGRYDATNVINSPIATLFTPISYDHQPFLGNSLGAIASEKAAIAKPNVPILTTCQEIETIHILEKTSNILNAPLLKQGKEWDLNKNTNVSFLYKWAEKTYELSLPNLQGDHQIQNTCLALSTLHHLDLIKDKEALKKGITQVRWPGRLMSLTYKGAKILLDGAHNVSAATCLAHYLTQQNEKVNLIFSMTKNEDIFHFLATLKPHITILYCPHLSAPFVDRLIIEKTCRTLKIPYKEVDTLEKALNLGCKNPEQTLITGSLYLVGDVMKLKQLK